MSLLPDALLRLAAHRVPPEVRDDVAEEYGQLAVADVAAVASAAEAIDEVT
jgi:hypothetical protein